MGTWETRICSWACRRTKLFGVEESSKKRGGQGAEALLKTAGFNAIRCWRTFAFQEPLQDDGTFVFEAVKG